MASKYVCYTIIAALFTVFMGEFLPVFLADNVTFIQHTIPISICYIIISFIFSLFIFRIKPIYVVIFFFIYGVIMETFVFRNIHELLGVFFFGTQYVAIFGFPYYLTKKLLRINFAKKRV